jgi:hypothetical protein
MDWGVEGTELMIVVCSATGVALSEQALMMAATPAPPDNWSKRRRVKVSSLRSGNSRIPSVTARSRSPGGAFIDSHYFEVDCICV